MFESFIEILTTLFNYGIAALKLPVEAAGDLSSILSSK